MKPYKSNFIRERMKMRYIPILVFFVFLSACSPAAKTAVATPAASPTVPSPTGPFDGQWQGTGSSSDGKAFTIIFFVNNSVVTGIRYSFATPHDPACFNDSHARIQSSDQPHIKDNAFTAPLGTDLSLSTVFSSDSSASGHLSGMLSGYRRIFCNTSYEVDWIATKQIVQAPAPPSQTTPRSSPLETLIQILVFGLSNGSVLALNAIGVTIIYSTVRTLNLAHGDVFALATVVVTTWVRGLGIQQNWSSPQLIGGLLIVFFIAVIAGAVLSVGVEELAFKPFRGHSRFAPMIASLGLSFILFQGALVWRTLQPSWIPGEHRSVPGLPEVPTDGIPNLLPEVNLIKTFNLPFHLVVRLSDVFVLVIALVFVALATWFLQRTRTGHAIRAYSQNPMLSQILGINLDQTILRAFAFGGALAGAAAFIFAIYYGRPFGVHGAQSGLMAFAAALLGGIGNPLGALVSGLLIGMVSSLSDYYLSAQWTSVLMMTLLIGLLVWRPTGLTASDADETTAVRDSVILTEPGKSQAKNRQLLIILILLAVVPILLQTFGLDGQTILQIIGIFIALTLGLNLAFGVAGILDFGFALSYGVGAYVWAILSPNIGYAPAMLSGILAAAITGLIKGGLSWRLRGDYLAVATLAFGLLGSQVIINLGWLTGGAGGIGNLPKPSLFGFQFQSLLARYFIVFAAIVFAVWLSQRLTLSRSGRSWIAASEDEEVASAVGINVERTRLLASIISSALAGLAGALYASTFSFVDPEVLSFYTTSLVLTMVILGGAGSITGVMIGAATIVLYDKVFVSKLADLVALIWPKNLFIGPVPDIRGANFFNFGIALYLTVLLRARRKNSSKKINLDQVE